MKKNENRDDHRLRKILQYVMLLLLLTAAFVLPKYGVMKREMQSERRNGSYTKMNENTDKKINQSINQNINQDINKKTDKNIENINESINRNTGEDTSEYIKKNQKDMSEEKNHTDAEWTIVLDPGHGGRDGGMTGSSGVPEKELNLIYAKKLAVLLEQEGYRVILTRNTDAGLYDETASHKKAQDMQRRCAIIEAEQPLLTVSIHQNSYPQDSSVRGPQVFYYEHSAEGEKLAACIQNEMNEQLNMEKPRTPKANGNYYILKRSASTTVLVEVGFLTNPQEEMLLQQEEYQDRTVCAMRDGIKEYLDG